MDPSINSLVGVRHRFSGTVSRFGYKTVNKKVTKTVIIINIKYNEEIVIDHQWFELDMFPLVHPGDTLSFSATIEFVIKGFKSRRKGAKDKNNGQLRPAYILTKIRDIKVLTP